MLLTSALHVVSHGIAVTYCLMTLHQPHRSLMLAGYGCGLASGIVGLWAARTVTTKASVYRVSFTILMITLVVAALGAYWDGGAASPAAVGFVTTAVFVAGHTPHLRLMMGLAALTVGSYLAVAATGRPAPPGHVFLYVAAMVVLISVCSAQARILARQRSQLRSLAELDPLTGALNRRGLAEFTKHLFRNGCRPGPSLLCLDLDDFKLVNDRLGHSAGDRLLQLTVAATRDVLRVGDAIARIGGDEFVVVLVDADDVTVRTVLTRIDAAVRPHASISIGSATAPHDGDTLETLMQVADQRLYRMKQEHRFAADPPLKESPGLLPSRSDPVGLCTGSQRPGGSAGELSEPVRGSAPRRGGAFVAPPGPAGQ
ncbi:GGDEF domain-containing protein [Micromonospora inositola]|uniref:Diguanylate cyclase (GGDEF) domain-containing protein n=1 Tax=Micromonospora inositola TaxID=47865 RepID=A0A1C5JT82_9ACTN|nr:GGDEF domain-containing protein [Micromonospora inositola]SCG73708.1 diguanylate cyclase (GGDEF) domain-containing protein [Micromonospora inositola]